MPCKFGHRRQSLFVVVDAADAAEGREVVVVVDAAEGREVVVVAAKEREEQPSWPSKTAMPPSKTAQPMR